MGSSSRGNRPRMACEISVDRIVAGRAAERGDTLDVYTSRELPEGSLAPDLTEANVLRREVLRDTIADALQSIGERSRDVIAVLPDSSARVVLLDFETLPAKPQEAEGVVRFRLKKSLPFDVEHAKVSYQAHVSGKGVRVIAAVALTSVIQEYESAFRDAGYNPGVMLPSMLAALGAVDADKPTMVVKVDAFTTSIALMDGSQLLLFRTLENSRGLNLTGEQLAEEVYPSVVFFQDTYHMNIERILVAGLPDSESFNVLQNQTGIAVEELVSARRVANVNGNLPRWRLAGVLGALAS
jgi:type IV pilus assembly protein PilM